jgi:hypothetical protein
MMGEDEGTAGAAEAHSKRLGITAPYAWLLQAISVTSTHVMVVFM